jgi:hypothetical protein
MSSVLGDLAGGQRELRSFALNAALDAVQHLGSSCPGSRAPLKHLAAVSRRHGHGFEQISSRAVSATLSGVMPLLQQRPRRGIQGAPVAYPTVLRCRCGSSVIYRNSASREIGHGHPPASKRERDVSLSLNAAGRASDGVSLGSMCRNSQFGEEAFDLGHGEVAHIAKSVEWRWAARRVPRVSMAAMGREQTGSRARENTGGRRRATRPQRPTLMRAGA